jgi:hypothetical protein
MNSKLLLTSVLAFLLSTTLWAQKKYSISGYVKDKGTTETLIGVNVVAPKAKKGTVSNSYGFYTLQLPEGKHTIEISYVGYETQSFEIDLKSNITRNVKLREETNELSAIVLEEKQEDRNVRSAEISTISISPKVLKKVPVVLGEQDLVKSLTLLPGVTTAREGASGFNVRGGKVDQNLILIDESAVFNSSHLFGFFSIFNSDAIKDATLYKGGIPAPFGGRLSSVLDIKQKEGNKESYHGKGGIGLLSSRLMLEGPIVRDKISFMLAGRRSYADLFLPLVGNDQIRDSKFYFYDFNGKANYVMNDNNTFFLSGYIGRDVFKLSDELSFDWGNKNVSFRWNHLFSPKLFSNHSLLYSKYNYRLDLSNDQTSFDWSSYIENINLKSDYSYYLNEDNTIRFGLDAYKYNFDLGTISGSNEATELGRRFGYEPSLYVSNEMKIGARWLLDYGVRLNSYFNVGSQEVTQYLNDKPVVWDPVKRTYEAGQVTGKKSYASNELINSTAKLLPRFRMRYELDENSSLKVGYNKMVQNIHLISNSTSPTPINVWIPNNEYIKPEEAQQVSLGYFRNFDNNKYELSVETYYKDMNSVIDYKDLARLVLNADIEQEILPGVGRSYGLEVYFKKAKGRFTGWLSYTLSKTELKVEGFGGEGETGINNGEWYNASYDKPHDLSLTLMYDITDRWSASMNFVYASGIPTNYPVAGHQFQGHEIPVFDGIRNVERIPDYNRVDVSAIYKLTDPKDKKRFNSDLVFGIYNVYNRYNAAAVTFEYNEDLLRNQAIQTTYFGIIPSVTWNFEF